MSDDPDFRFSSTGSFALAPRTHFNNLRSTSTGKMRQASASVWQASECMRIMPLSTTAKEAVMSISKTRGLLYLLAKLLGDVQAVKRGRVGKRIARRVAGKMTGRGLGKIFRK